MINRRLTLVPTVRMPAPKRCANSDYPLPIVFLSACYKWSLSHLHATKSKKHNKKDLTDDCRDMVTIGGTCRDPWSIHTTNNIVEISFCVFTFHVFYFLLIVSCILLFYILLFCLQHVAGVRHESGIIVSALIDFSITFYFPLSSGDLI